VRFPMLQRLLKIGDGGGLVIRIERTAMSCLVPAGSASTAAKEEITCGRRPFRSEESCHWSDKGKGCRYSWSASNQPPSVATQDSVGDVRADRSRLAS